jgi:hypothetical protein
MEPVDIPVAPDALMGAAETVESALFTLVGVTLAKELEGAITPALVAVFRTALLVGTTLAVVERELVEEELELEAEEELLLEEAAGLELEVVVACVGVLEEVVGATSAELEVVVGEDL